MSGILELQLFGNPSEQTHSTLTIYSDSSELHKKEKRKKKKEKRKRKKKPNCTIWPDVWK